MAPYAKIRSALTDQCPEESEDDKGDEEDKEDEEDEEEETTPAGASAEAEPWGEPVGPRGLGGAEPLPTEPLPRMANVLTQGVRALVRRERRREFLAPGGPSPR
nr:hypothetical protein [Streptomyces tsukubensis NRRL18488]